MTRIISVYFNGSIETNNIPANGRVSLAALLDQLTEDEEGNISYCVNGCALNNQDIRDLGILFTYHLTQQVGIIAQKVEQMVNKHAKDNIVLNVYGFSRGGSAAFLLCQNLKHISRDRLTINVAAFEPVTGNFNTTAYGDVLIGLNSTLCASVADLTQCRNIDNMLILFANQSVKIPGHDPILPALPANCKAEIDVTPGYHKDAESFTKKQNTIEPDNNESAVVFHRIVEFMEKCGTSFDFSKYQMSPKLVCPSDDNKESIKNQLLNTYQTLLEKVQKDTTRSRVMHLKNTIFTASPADHKKFLNKKHQELSGENEVNNNDIMLSLQNYTPKKTASIDGRITLFAGLVFALATANMLYQKYQQASPESSYQPGA